MRRGALRRSVSLGAMGVAVAAGLGGGTEQALANCTTAGATTTCTTAAPNPFTSRVGNSAQTNRTVNVNSGAGIQVNGDNAIQIGSGTITINTGGQVGASNAAAISVNSATTNNSGTIAGTDGGGIITTSGPVNNLSGGSITSSGAAAITSSTAAINNSGSISAINGTGINAAAGSISNQAGASILATGAAAIDFKNGTINNLGSITSSGGQPAILHSGTGGNPGITNRAGATISGGSGGVALDSTGDAPLTFTNFGTITGNMFFGAGSDNLTVHPGSVINGTVDGGTGSDLLTLTGTGNGTFATSAINIETLTVSGGVWTVSSSITGLTSGSIQNGATLVMNAPSSLTGTMFLTTGSTLVTRAADFPAGTINNSGGLVRFDQPAGTEPYAGNILSGGAVEKTGPGMLILTGNNSYSGGTTISQGVLQVGNGGTAGVLPGNVVNNASLVFNRSNALTFAGAISGTGSVTQAGTGVLTLTGANGYSGGSFVNAGTLEAGSDGVLGGPSSGLTLNGGTFRYGAAFGLGAGRAVSVGGSGGTINTQGFAATIGGPITGSGALTKTGSGSLTLTGNSSYSSNTTVAGGSLQLGNGGTSGSVQGNIQLNAGTGLVLNRSDSFILPGVVSGAGSLTQAGTGTAILTGNNSYTGGTTISQGTLRIGNGGTTGAITGNVANNSRLEFRRSDDVAFNGAISGSGSLIQSGTGVLTLTGANSYAGGTIVTSGVLAAAANSALGDPAGGLTLDGGTFRYLSSFALDRPISLGNGNGTIDSNGYNAAISRIISGPGALTKAGAGVLTLAADNAYTGGTVIAAGTLQLGNGGTSGSIVGDVVNNGNLAFNRSDVVTFGGLISGAGSVTQRGSGTTILTADNSYSGGTTIAAGTLQLGDGGTSGAITGDVVNNGNLAFNRSDVVTFGGLISGAGSVTQRGSGTTILTADNSYSGGTTIANGTLQLGGGGASGSITGDVANDGMLVFDRSNRLDFAGVISGSGAVTQAGTGITVLGQVQSYRGETRVQAGTLAIGRGDGTPGGLAGGGALTVEAGGSFGGYGQVAGPASNRGTILVADALPIFAGGPLGTLAFASGLVNGGVLDLRGAVAGNRLRVAGGYAGTGGTLKINTVLAADNAPSDQLVVDGGRAIGSTGLLVSNAGGTGALTVANGIRVIDAVNGAVTEAGAFSLAAPVLAGPYRYSLYRGAKDGSAADDWFLRSEDTRPEPPDPPTPPEPTPDYREETSIYATLPGQALTYGRTLVGTFHERMGDSAHGLAPGGADDRLWGRVFGLAGSVEGQPGGKSTDNPDYDDVLIGFEAGGDLYRATSAAGTRQAAGLSGGFGRMGAEVRTQRGVDAGDTRMSVFSGGGYWTSLGAGGWYVDARALASLYDASASSFQDVQFDTLGAGLAGSLEAGYPLALMPGLVAEPQLQAVAQGLWMGDDSDGHADISFDDAASLATRAGLRLAYTRADGDGFGVTVWARGDVWHDWLSPDPAVNFSSEDGPVDFHAMGDDTWLAARVGVSALRSDRLQLHGSLGAERSLDGRAFAVDARLGAVFSW